MTTARSGHFYAVILCVLLAFANAAGAVDEIVVGAWNIEFLGAPNRRDDTGKGVLQEASDIATCVKTSGVNLLALEEICVKKDSPGLTNAVLDDTVKTLNEESSAKWKYQLFKAKGKGRQQLTGVMWNEAVIKQAGEPFRVPMEIPKRKQGEPDYWTRWATAMKFSAGEGKTDIVVIPVHMKSNRAGAEAGAAHRHQEALLLTSALDKVRNHFSDHDILIVGDTNMLGASEKGWKVFTGTGFVDLNGRDETTYISEKYPNSPLDRAFVPNTQPEFVASKLEVYKPTDLSPADFRKKLSDHYMIKFNITVMPDDD